MGMPLLAALLLLLLACVAVKPRTKGVLYGTTGVVGALLVVLVVLMLLGYVHWGWDVPR